MTLTNATPFIAGNWKLHKTIPEALELAENLQRSAAEMIEAEVVVIPSFTALSEVKRMLENSSIQIGAQNLFWEDEGAYTGEISAPMLLDAGCQYVIIGHSERRKYFGETNATTHKKIRSALAHGLIPILCVGESLDEREKGLTTAKVAKQVTEGFLNLSGTEAGSVIIAYEPLWAIGTGLTATPSQAQEVHAFIRHLLEEKYGNKGSEYAIILYGGSVKPANTFSLLKEKDINGALVGGASLKAESFVGIVKEAINAYKEK